MDIYFIFSNSNYNRDYRLSVDIHHCLPHHIGMQEARIRGNNLVRLKDDLIIRANIPDIISRRERPLYITEPAYDSLVEAVLDPEENSIQIQRTIRRMLAKREIVEGERDMIKFIEELRARPHF